MLKKLIAKSLARDSVVSALRLFQQPRATIFMMHRFQVPELGVEGHDPMLLRTHLAYLRRQRFRIVPLVDLLNTLISGERLTEHTVAFTVDDGYSDFWDVGIPVFSEFDCPVTMFLITDFIAGNSWNWWDRIEHIVTQTATDRLVFTVGDQTLEAGRAMSVQPQLLERLVEAHKLVSDEEKESSIRRLGTLLGVEPPSIAPPRYEAMTWDHVRAASARGVTFGPHTVTHPVLSRVSDERACLEITESWRTVSRETSAAIPVFCYPNGNVVDFTARERAVVSDLGMAGALSTAIGYASCSPGAGESFDRFAVRRFTYPDDTPSFVQIASGLEGVKDRLRLMLGWSPGVVPSGARSEAK